MFFGSTCCMPYSARRWSRGSAAFRYISVSRWRFRSSSQRGWWRLKSPSQIIWSCSVGLMRWVLSSRNFVSSCIV